LQAADSCLNLSLPILFDYWYGTRWDLNGTSQTPGEGKIACGYFVANILKDSGLPIQRVKMGQMASEPFIRQLVSEKSIKRFHKIPLDDFVAQCRKMGEGIFIVGLDTHIGFLWVQKEQSFFIHSSSLAPTCVIREEASQSITLKRSSYRIVGKISGDAKFLGKWLE
jgi:hypothetical protein